MKKDLILDEHSIFNLYNIQNINTVEINNKEKEQ